MLDARRVVPCIRVRPRIAGMNTTESERKPGTQTENKHRSEPPWNVIWHNEWENPLRWVTLVLRKVIVAITLERATKTA